LEVIAFAATLPTCTKLEDPEAARSMVNPVSLFELSRQESVAEPFAPLPVRLLGALITFGLVVTLIPTDAVAVAP